MVNNKCEFEAVHKYFIIFQIFHIWDYSNESVLASVFVTWRKYVRNIFSIPYNTHCNLVHLIAQDSSVRVKLHKRYLKFLIVPIKAITP